MLGAQENRLPANWLCFSLRELHAKHVLEARVMKKLNKQAREQANDVSDPTTNANLYIDEYLYDTHTHTHTSRIHNENASMCSLARFDSVIELNTHAR